MVELHEVFATDLPNQTTCFTSTRECKSITARNIHDEYDRSLTNPKNQRSKTVIVSRLSSEYSSLEISYSVCPENGYYSMIGTDSTAKSHKLIGGFHVNSHSLPKGSSTKRKHVRDQKKLGDFCASHSHKTFMPLTSNAKLIEKSKTYSEIEAEDLFLEVFAIHHPPSMTSTSDQQLQHLKEDDTKNGDTVKSGQRPDSKNTKAAETDIKGSLVETKSSSIKESTPPNTSTPVVSDRAKVETTQENDNTKNVASIVIRGTWLTHWYQNVNEKPVTQLKEKDDFQQILHVDYHPLPVHIAEVSLPRISTTAHTCSKVPGIYVASSDNSLVRLFLPSFTTKSHDDQNHFIEVIAKDNQNHHQVPTIQTSYLIRKDIPSSHDFSSLSFPLSFSSSVMALSSLLVDNKANSNDGHDPTEQVLEEDCIHFLAVGCQDGSIYVILYKFTQRNGQGRTFHSDSTPIILYVYNFFVDGPIISMQLSLIEANQKNNLEEKIKCIGHVHLTVGSLCGYACQFHLSIPSQHWSLQHKVSPFWNSEPFHGPFHILDQDSNETINHIENKSLHRNRSIPVLCWDGRLDAEDAVLAVHEFVAPTLSGLGIAIGTHSGRILLYECMIQSNLELKFRLLWKDRLPYPIHGICVADLDGDELPEMLVTTRKSIHIYRFDAEDIASVTKKWLEMMIGNDNVINA